MKTVANVKELVKDADKNRDNAYFFDPKAVSTSKPNKKFGIRSRISTHGLISVNDGVINRNIVKYDNRKVFTEKAKKFIKGGAEK